MAKPKPTPYPYILGGSLKLDVAFFAPKMIDEHADLIARGYVLASPVAVTIRKDGRVVVPFRYRRPKAAGGDPWNRCGWTVTTYVSALFGRMPEGMS